MDKMTPTSAANIRVADKAGFDVVGGPAGGVIVWLERQGNRAYVSSKDGPIIYADRAKARRNLRRLRLDLEPTDI